MHGHEGEEEEEDDNEEEKLHTKRENDLDFQYEESDEKLWANIPPGQKLSFPSLPNLLHSSTTISFIPQLQFSSFLNYNFLHSSTAISFIP